MTGRLLLRDTRPAMSREHVDVVRAGYAAMRRRDPDAFLALVDPDVEFSSLIMEADGATYRGPGGVRDYLAGLLAALPDWRPAVEAVEAAGDAALVRARVAASGAGSGAAAEQVMWQHVIFRGGRIASWRFFRTEAEARRAFDPPPELEAARRAYEALDRDDVGDAVREMHPDVEFRTSGAYPGLRPVYRGREGVREFWSEFRGTFVSLRFDVRELWQRGDRVVALYVFEAASREGIAVTRPGANVFVYRDGRAVRIDAYADWESARAAGQA